MFIQRVTRLLVRRHTREVIPSCISLNQSLIQKGFFSSDDASSASNKEEENSEPKLPPVKTPPFTFRTLGLWKPVVELRINHVQRLDEVRDCLDWTRTDSEKIVADLRRATEVVASFAPGTFEHLSTLGLWAERCTPLKGQEIESIKAILELQSADLNIEEISEDTEMQMPTLFAAAKAFLMQGDTKSSIEATTELLNVLDLPEHKSEKVKWAAATHYKVVGHLLTAAATIEETSPPQVMETYIMCHMGLSKQAELLSKKQPTLAASIYNTMGIMECRSIYKAGAKHLPPNKSFAKAIKLLDNKTSLLATRMLATLKVNQAISLLALLPPHQVEPGNAFFDEAARLAKEALVVVEQPSDEIATSEYHFSLGRTLTLLGRLHAAADAAVSAEGLYQSSIDHLKKGSGHLNKVALLDAYREYAKLLNQWDKREGDAKQYEVMCENMKFGDEEGMWQTTQPIIGGLMMLTPWDVRLYGKARKESKGEK